MTNLTKQDKNDIKGIIDNSLEVNFPKLFEKALAPLAGAIQQDFQKVHKNFQKVHKNFQKAREDIKSLDGKFTERFNKVDDDINYIHGHLALIEGKLDKKADQETVHSLHSRVAELETKTK